MIDEFLELFKVHEADVVDVPVRLSVEDNCLGHAPVARACWVGRMVLAGVINSIATIEWKCSFDLNYECSLIRALKFHISKHFVKWLELTVLNFTFLTGGDHTFNAPLWPNTSSMTPLLLLWLLIALTLSSCTRTSRCGSLVLTRRIDELWPTRGRFLFLLLLLFSLLRRRSSFLFCLFSLRRRLSFNNRRQLDTLVSNMQDVAILQVHALNAGRVTTCERLSTLLISEELELALFNRESFAQVGLQLLKRLIDADLNAGAASLGEDTQDYLVAHFSI